MTDRDGGETADGGPEAIAAAPAGTAGEGVASHPSTLPERRAPPGPPPADRAGIVARLERRLPARLRPALAGGVAKILGGGLWLMLAKAVFMAASLVVNVLLARTLSQADASLFVLVQGLALVLGLLASLSTGQAAVRFLGEARRERPGEVPGIVEAALAIAFLASLAVGFLVAVWPVPGLLARYRPGLVGEAALLVPLAAWTLFVALRWTVFRSFVGLGEFRRGAWFDGGVGTCLFASGLALLWAAGAAGDLRLTLGLGIGAYLVESALGVALLRRRLRHALGLAPRARRPRLWRDLVVVGAPMMAANLILQLTNQIPLWFLSATRPIEEVALFGFAFRLMVAVSVVFAIGAQAALPEIARLLAAGEKAQLQRLLRRTNLVILAATTLLALPFLLVPGLVVTTLFGQAYAAAAAPLAILALAELAQAAAGPAQVVLSMAKRERTFLLVSALTCLAVPLLCLALVPSLGATGAAIATATASVARTFACLHLCKRLTGISTTPFF